MIQDNNLSTWKMHCEVSLKRCFAVTPCLNLSLWLLSKMCVFVFENGIRNAYLSHIIYYPFAFAEKNRIGDVVLYSAVHII